MNEKEIRPSLWKRSEDCLVVICEQDSERNELMREGNALLVEIKALLIEIKDALENP